MKKNCSIALIVMMAFILCPSAFAEKVCPKGGEVYPDSENFCGIHGVKLKVKKARFKSYANGTVLDTRTKLMWAAKDNGSDITWDDAKSYCENYRRGGHKDWRMPTQDELAGLYDANISYRATQRDYDVN